MSAAGRKKRAGKHIKHARSRPYESRHKRIAPDPFDAVLDARSEARYEDDPGAEPTLEDVKAARYLLDISAVDESGGLRGDVRG